MSGGPRARSMNVAESESRPVLGPAGNKNRAMSTKRPSGKLSKAEKAVIEENVVGELEEKKKMVNSSVNVTVAIPVSPPAVGVLRRQEQLLHSGLSMSASCSSDASSDSFRSRASTGRLMRTSSGNLGRRKHYLWKPKVSASDGVLEFSLSPPADGLQQKKRCAWVTPNTEPCYFAFHDEEWGVPVHDDKKLFELLVLSGALAELTWPVILSKRHIFREVFADFDPIAVSKFNEKKILAPGSTARSLLSELKLRAIIENARQICKVIVEVGSFDNYIWSFVNHKPIISRFRYPRQVPVKTPKADVISKDLVRRGFRSVGPTVIYSFMQIAGITNDHLISCFRFQECINMEEGKEDTTRVGSEEKKPDDANDSDLCRGIDDLSFSSEC